jgi:hypothetical protein
VYVLIPAHAGSGDITGAEAVSVLPQLSSTTGGVGGTASAGQATVDAPGAGIVTTGAEIV